MSAILEPPRRGTEVALCPVEEIPLGMGHSFEVAGRLIAVFRKRNGQIHAVDGTCPHRGAPLADGIIAGDRVVCPFHAMRFDLKTGDCDHPETCPIQVYPSHVRDGWIHVTVSA
jgi:nitrite reductase (NADH) small subunit